MIDYIKGKIVYKGKDEVVVDKEGIGIRISTSIFSVTELGSIGATETLFTELIVREDSLSLVGFASRDELKMFKLLTSVSGVGTKVGIGILSSLNYKDVERHISSNDVKALTSAQGVGKKTAERIILELKDKVDSSELIVDTAHTILKSEAVDDALEALSALGYSKSEANSMINKLDVSGLSADQIINQALKAMMGS